MAFLPMELFHTPWHLIGRLTGMDRTAFDGAVADGECSYLQACLPSRDLLSREAG